MKKIIKLLSLVLALLVVPITLSACNREPENPTGYIGTFQSKVTFDYNTVFGSLSNHNLLIASKDTDSYMLFAPEDEIEQFLNPYPPYTDPRPPHNQRVENGREYLNIEIGTTLILDYLPNIDISEIDNDLIMMTNGWSILNDDPFPAWQENGQLKIYASDLDVNIGVPAVFSIPFGETYYYSIWVTAYGHGEQPIEQPFPEQFVKAIGTADNCSWTDSNSFWLAYLEMARTYSFIKTNPTAATLTISLTDGTRNIQIQYALSKVGEYWKLGSYTTSGLPFTIPMYELTLDENGQGTFGTSAPEGTGGNYDTAFTTQVITYSVSSKTITFAVSGQAVNGTFSNNFTKLTLNLGGQSVAFDKAL